MYRPTHIAAVAPTVNDDITEGFHRGNFWWNTVTNGFYVLEDEADGAAVWVAATDPSIGGWDDYVPTLTWTGNTPLGVSYVARYQATGNLVAFTIDVTGTNAIGASITDLTISMPDTVADNDNYIPVSSYSLINGVYASSNVAAINGTDNTPANRILVHYVFGAIGSGIAFGLYYRGFFENV